MKQAYLFDVTGTVPVLREDGESALQTWRDQGGYANHQQFVWLDLSGETDPAVEEQLLRSAFGIEKMAIQDAQRTRHPPKFEAFADYYFILLRGLSSKSTTIDFQTIQIALFIGTNFIVTRHPEPSPSVEKSVRQFIESPELLALGPKAAAPLIGRNMVDRYLTVLLSLEPRLDSLELEMVENPTAAQLSEITGYKTRLKKLRRIFSYHEQVFSRARTSEFANAESRLTHHFNDTYEQIERANSLAVLYYDLASDLMNSSISMESHRLNGIMKVLTIITAIFVPLGFIAGVYGMNFEYMPELGRPTAYFTVLSTMGVIALGSLIIFRIKKWI
ncbi:MAG: magnesium transporter CorA family protein [Pseudomonadales bacterium]|nr:magnesium transporter CorA family protein [Pseudomonadales bacterium]